MCLDFTRRTANHNRNFFCILLLFFFFYCASWRWTRWSPTASRNAARTRTTLPHIAQDPSLHQKGDMLTCWCFANNPSISGMIKWTTRLQACSDAAATACISLLAGYMSFSSGSDRCFFKSATKKLHSSLVCLALKLYFSWFVSIWTFSLKQGSDFDPLNDLFSLTTKRFRLAAAVPTSTFEYVVHKLVQRRCIVGGKRFCYGR